MAQLFKNNVSGVLSAQLSAIGISMTLVDASNFPDPATDFYSVTLVGLNSNGQEDTWEVVNVTSKASNTLSITRAQEGTTALLWPAATTVQMRLTAGFATEIESHTNSSSNPHAVTKTQVGLGNVDNTNDSDKPVSTAQQNALNLKANIASPTFTGTVGGITAAMVGAPTGTGTSTGNNTGDQDLSGKQNVLVSGTNIKTVNSQSILGVGDIEISSGATVYTYDSRSALRSQTPTAGEQAIVDGLGLFVWEAGSTEPDDDESAFATASGVWLLEAAHWDLVDAWQSPEWQAVADDDEDEPLRFASKILTGSATCSITSVANFSSVSFTGTATGAAVGDRVIATPPAQLGSTTVDTGRLGYHAWVSAPNTVTITLTNASSVTAITNTAIQTVWPITIIKS